ncbi:hypothetical protein J4N46_03280 [Capnocytophaga sp. Marseille-Q4570]|uniref:Phosphate-selective porin O and P n=1 Tax=Capnocytophaga bilenii TaxID=2819369 RepID=A0ABS3PVV2_9FLAO|nr:porin [Capnocytophaga bilenii]MBO1883469.1 hypothetical protein [Capnocytophaga bilenii]
MKKMFFTVMVLGVFGGLNAQITDSLPQGVTPTEIKVVAEAKPAVPSFAEKLNIDLFFRGGMVADSYDNDARNNTRFVIDNARLNFQGDFNKDLFYRLRFRPSRPFTANSQDGGASALDYAFITYRFGGARQWDVTLGKQLAAFGSFEKEINPLYEYIFSDYLNGVYNNVFLSGLNLGYKVDDKQRVGVQLHNTFNNTFAEHLKANGLSAGNFKASKTPIGAYLYWYADFGKFKLRYSYNVSQYATDKLTHSVALGNSYKSGKHSVYLDLSYSHMAADYGTTVSKLLAGVGTPTMEGDAVYKRAVSRYDYQLTDRWSLSAKVGVELAGSTQQLSEQLRANWIYFGAVQYAPLQGQDLRFYVAYVGNTISYYEALHRKNEQLNRIAIGAYYTLPILKTKN